MVYCSKKTFLGGTMMELTEEIKALLMRRENLWLTVNNLQVN
jgi:hypothetical protein